MKNRPPISIVIPTYNGQALLQKHLPAVLQAMQPEDELIVIDDASSDSTEFWFKEWKRDKTKYSIQYIQNIANLRFAATVNKAVREASHAYVFVLNNDVAPHKDVLESLWNCWQSYEQPDTIFAIGCLEYEQDPNSKRKPVLGGKNKLWFERGMFIHSRYTDMKTGPTAWASGGSALFDKKKWEALGGFDRAFYPAYWEDIDLSVRARKQGWEVLFCAEAKVDHHHETTNATVFGQQRIAYMSWKNAFIFTWRHMKVSEWIQHIVWLPYHLFITGSRTKGLTIRAFLAAVSNT